MPQCKLKNCPYNADGRCVENQLPNCPNLVPDGESKTSVPGITAADVQPKSKPPPPKYETLYSSQKLTAAEATEILQSNCTQVVALGGMVESGKTTLLARVFEMFQSGLITTHNFVRSRTLADFDKLSWHATMESGASKASTEHTSSSENNLFLHIRVRTSRGNGTVTDLLIADIPGEIFPEAVSDEKVCLNLCALRRADHLVLFLDCDALRDVTKRDDHCGKVFAFVSRALQTGQIGKHTVLHLVISKCDVLPKDSKDFEKFVEDTEHLFSRKFAARFGDLRCWRLAARPLHPAEPTLAEIGRIFNEWMCDGFQQATAASSPRTPNESARDFCRFGWQPNL
jgi:hypothetical protein